MNNPRMNERNRVWKQRVTAAGVAGFVALSALIGKQAEQSQTANAAAVTTSAQPSATTIDVAGLTTNIGNVSSDTASTATAVPATAPAVATATTVAATAVPTATAAPTVAASSTTKTTTSASSSSSTKVNTRTSASK